MLIDDKWRPVLDAEFGKGRIVPLKRGPLHVHIHLYDDGDDDESTPAATRDAAASTHTKRTRAQRQRDPYAREAATKPVHQPVARQEATLRAINAANRRAWER